MLMNELLPWYLTLQLFALAGLPLAFAWLRRLPSRGYAAAKVLGLLLSGVLFWWGGILQVWNNTPGAALTAAALLLLVGLWQMRGHWAEVRTWWKSQRAFVITTEMLFLAAFLLWAIVRASQPQLETAGGEKWMEIAFLNAVLRSPTMPPHDPWLSGYAISYYYLGYLLLGMLTQVAALPATVAFNLGNAAWFALAAVGAYGVVYDMLDGRRPGGALFAPLLLLVTGSGEGFLEVLHARGLLPASFWSWLDIRSLNVAPTPPFSWVPTRFFWWWQASRTLHDHTPWGETQEIIDEFPAFSFTLGDMHPHLLALPFVLLAVALALNLWKRVQPPQTAPADGGLIRQWLLRLRPWLGYALVLGALGFLNTWDFPIYWALIVGVMVLGWRGSEKARKRKGEKVKKRVARSGDRPQLERKLGPAAGRPSVSRPHGLRQTCMSAISRLCPSEVGGTLVVPQIAGEELFDLLRGVLPDAVALGVFSVLLYLPFWVGLRSQAGGFLPNLFNATRLPQFIVMFIPLVIPVTGVIVVAARRASVRLRQVLGWGVLVVLGALLAGLLMGVIVGSPYLQAIRSGQPIMGLNISVEDVTSALTQRLLNPWTALLLTTGILTLFLALWRGETAHSAAPWAFPALLALLGLGLTLAPEFFFLKDNFNTRMNTVFKFYFQAWVLWSLAGAWWLARATEKRGTLSGKIVPALAGLLIAVGMVYTLLAVPARAREHGAPWTLDGAAWLADSHPEDWAAINWLNANVSGRPVILETPGDSHKAYVYEGRVSALTGLPTVLGWSGHEYQWRGNYDEQARREQDLETLFTTNDPTLTRALLERYEVVYIYIGPTERNRYPAEGLEKFEAFPVVYRNEGVVIYRVTE